MSLTDRHRLLLQTLLYKPFQNEKELLEIYRTINDDYSGDVRNVEEIEDFLIIINKSIEFLGLNIKRGITEDEGEPYWCLINTVNDEISRTILTGGILLASTLSKTEGDFFKKVVDLIIVPERKGQKSKGELHHVDALNIAGKSIGLSITQATATIKKLTSQGWLIEKGSKLSIGLRTLIELRPYLEETYATQNDEDESNIGIPILVDCVLCHELVGKGPWCPNEKCSTRLHGFCATKWFHGKSVKKCPTCDTNWYKKKKKLL